MSKLLFDEAPIVVDRVMAKAIGLNEALVVQQLHYWLMHNKKKKQNFHDGRYWTYNSIKIWHEEEFNFLSYDTVKRTFAKLEKKGILITGNYNKDKRDRTKWYSIDHEKLAEIAYPPETIDTPVPEALGQNAPMPLGQNAPMREGKMHQPLPKTSTKTSTKISNNKTVVAEKEKTTSTGKEPISYDSSVSDTQNKADLKILSDLIQGRLNSKLTQDDLSAIWRASDRNIVKVVNAVNSAQQMRNIDNLTGFLISAIQGEYKKAESKRGKSTGFGFLEQRSQRYSNEELEEMLLSKQRQKWQK